MLTVNIQREEIRRLRERKTVNTEKALRDRIKQDRTQFIAHREHIKGLSKELREARKLIVAFVTEKGDIESDESGGRTYALFLDDRAIANVAHDDVLSVVYDNRRGGNVYRVAR